MRSREEISNQVAWYGDRGNYNSEFGVCINLEHVMDNLGLLVEVALDVRDLLLKEK